MGNKDDDHEELIATGLSTPPSALYLYNMNRFRTKTMYDYYIAMKSMFLVVKLSTHFSIDYASFTILLP